MHTHIDIHCETVRGNACWVSGDFFRHNRKPEEGSLSLLNVTLNLALTLIRSLSEVCSSTSSRTFLTSLPNHDGVSICSNVALKPSLVPMTSPTRRYPCWRGRKHFGVPSDEVESHQKQPRAKQRDRVGLASGWQSTRSAYGISATQSSPPRDTESS